MARSMQDCFNAAVSYSSLNEASLYDSDMALIHMSFFEQLAFMKAAEINPNYYGTNSTTSTRSAHDSSWDISGLNALTIEKIEVSTVTGSPSLSVGDEVNVIDINFPEFHISPRCYIRNNKIYNYNDELGADDTDFVDQLKIFHSFVPSVATSLSDTLSLSDRWAHLVITPMAAILALSDLRLDEYQALMEEYKEYLQLYLTFIGSSANREVLPKWNAPILNPGSLQGLNVGGN